MDVLTGLVFTDEWPHPGRSGPNRGPALMLYTAGMQRRSPPQLLDAVRNPRQSRLLESPYADMTLDRGVCRASPGPSPAVWSGPQSPLVSAADPRISDLA